MTHRTQTATFALGSFWGPDARFGCHPGVVRTRVGYAGGTHPRPDGYHDLGDHTEAFSARLRSGDRPLRRAAGDVLGLAQVGSSRVQPPVHGRRVPDGRAGGGALASRPAGAVTPVIASTRFYLAEDYHQKYYLRHTPDLLGELADLDARAFVESPARGEAQRRGLAAVACQGHPAGCVDVRAVGGARGRARARAAPPLRLRERARFGGKLPSPCSCSRTPSAASVSGSARRARSSCRARSCSSGRGSR